MASAVSLPIPCVFAQDDEEPRREVVHTVPPTYPALAARMHISGSVRVGVVVQPNGVVAKAHALSGHPLLEPAAVQAVRKWRFAPGQGWSSNVVEVRFDFNQKSN